MHVLKIILRDFVFMNEQEDFKGEDAVTVRVVSLTYYCHGHFKEYYDNFSKHFSEHAIIKKSVFGKHGSGFSSLLNFRGVGQFAKITKVLSRFFFSVIFYIQVFFNSKKNEHLFFMDYEYLSLIIGLFFFPFNKKTVLLHSTSVKGPSYYVFYKKIFFYFITQFPKVSFVVNGCKAKLDLVKLIGDEHIVNVIQYPSELSIKPLKKDAAKSKLSLTNKKIISLIGIIRSDKNYEQAIREFSKSHCCNNDKYVLAIYGASANVSFDQIVSFTVKYGVDNYIFVNKYLSESELNEIFSATDCLLVPYGDSGNSQSGPVSLARQYLLPVITIAGGEIGEYVTKYNVGMVSDNLNSLSSIIDLFFSDNVSVKLIEDNILSARDNFSWAAASQKYKKVFNVK